MIMFKANYFIKISTILCLYYLVNIQKIYSQEVKPPKHAIEIASDNDAFGLWDNQDRYYTFGIGPKFYLKTEKLLGLQNLFQKKEDYFFDCLAKKRGDVKQKSNLTTHYIPSLRAEASAFDMKQKCARGTHKDTLNQPRLPAHLISGPVANDTT